MTAPLRFAVIGDPIAHSLSPAMHAAAYRALGLPHTYEAIRAANEDLPELVAALRAGSYAGLNVTVPHKPRALALADHAAASARVTGAANTLVRDADGRVWAHNTDAPALACELRALTPRANGRGAGLVLGAGGAARAAVVALSELGAARIAVRARDARKAAALAEDLASVLGVAIAADAWTPGAPDPARERDTLWVVQATSAGMTGKDAGESVASAVAWEALPRGASVLDVVYAPPDTPLLHAARARGLAATNGLGMLARQGALAFELWLGVAPYDAMRAALART